LLAHLLRLTVRLNKSPELRARHMNSKKIIFAALAVACLAAFASAVEISHGTRDFALALQPIDSRISVGRAPRFRLTLTNISDHACRILNIERRRDLQDTYYDLIVIKNGRSVDVPRIISDPGPISDADWLQVPRGGTKTFTLTNFAHSYDTLPPGAYEAYVRFWRDPFQSHTSAYRSETAKFTVTK
jgi:hypothetical protein